MSNAPQLQNREVQYNRGERLFELISPLEHWPRFMYQERQHLGALPIIVHRVRWVMAFPKPNDIWWISSVCIPNQISGLHRSCRRLAVFSPVARFNTRHDTLINYLYYHWSSRLIRLFLPIPFFPVAIFLICVGRNVLVSLVLCSIVFGAFDSGLSRHTLRSHRACVCVKVPDVALVVCVCVTIPARTNVRCVCDS